MDIKTQILEATIKVFHKKGIKFTMDDLAQTLGMSKKTIYTVFKDKNALFLSMVDYLFAAIKMSENEIIHNDNLATVDKIQAILCVLPEGYKDLDFGQLYILKDKYPEIYKKVEKHLETGWENTIMLLEKGKEEGVIRDVNIPIVKMMLEASLEQFFQRDILKRNKISYQNALNEVVEILMVGISK
ncbi:MAG: TetR/AcrR family transcriptional regulator [Lachnospiraceae bacterium]|nr:TetR/AcrR family transcriptional regulator [Lachnospiraceae bacterium]